MVPFPSIKGGKVSREKEENVIYIKEFKKTRRFTTKEYGPPNCKERGSRNIHGRWRKVRTSSPELEEDSRKRAMFSRVWANVKAN